MKNRKIKIILLIEIIFLVFLALVFIRKLYTCELNASDLEIKYSLAYFNEEGTAIHITDAEEISDEQEQIEFARSGWLEIPFGVYELEVVYESDMEKAYETNGSVHLISEDFTVGIAYNGLNLGNVQSSAKDRFIIQVMPGIDDFHIKVYYSGVGELAIEKLMIREVPMWRMGAWILCILIFLLLDVGYYYFFVKNNPNRVVTVCLLGTIVFSSLPMFTDFLFVGHDLEFHLARILALAQSIGEGRWISPIADTMNHYGYTNPIFYGQLFLYMPAIFYNLGMPLQTCYQAYVFLINIVTCFISYWCFDNLVKNKKIAVTGAFLYVVAPYRICNIYVRAAVGEYTAMAFIPLIVYGFIKVYTSEQEKIERNNWFPIVLGLTGILNCHVLSCEMVAMFIMLTCLLLIKKTLQKNIFIALVKAAITTFIVNLAFIIPFLDSMQMDINVRKIEPYAIQGFGVYLVQLFSPFMTTSGLSGYNMTGEMPLVMGLSLGLGIVIFGLCYSKKKEWKILVQWGRAGFACMMLAIVAILFSLKFFPWDSIQNIHSLFARVFGMVQFSWRYIAIATVMASFTTAMGLAIYAKNKGEAECKLLSIVLIGLTLGCVGAFYTGFCDETETIRRYGSAIYDVSTNTAKLGEYLPYGTDKEQLRSREVLVESSDVLVEDYCYEKGIVTLQVKNLSEKDSYIDIPLLNYDNYNAFDKESKEEIAISNGSNNRIRLMLPTQYEGEVVVKYRIPILWKISYTISVLAVIYFFLQFCRGRKVIVKH